MKRCIKCFRPLDDDADDFCAACLGEILDPDQSDGSEGA